jgi:putative membrane protein
MTTLPLVASLLTGAVAVEHVYILHLEMFAWETKGPKVFRGAMSRDMFPKTKNMAANQGLYNGFLAAGLVWSLTIADPVWASRIASYFLGCVSVAGLYGGYSVSKRILFVQGLPALCGLLAVQLAI